MNFLFSWSRFMETATEDQSQRIFLIRLYLPASFVLTQRRGIHPLILHNTIYVWELVSINVEVSFMLVYLY